jgi:deoxyribonuclease-4
MHISGIEYTAMGERKHIELEKSDMNYKGLLRVLFDNDVSGVLICESPILEKDALRMKSFYDSL